MARTNVLNITSLGSVLFPLGLLLLSLFFVIRRRQIKMSSINDNAWQVFGLLLDQGFPFETAKIITAQAAHETGNFTSNIYQENNNPFGMKMPKQRRTTAKGEKNNHAFYGSIEEAIKDFWLYYKAVNLPESWATVEKYIEAIKEKGYFEAETGQYVRGVTYFYNLYFKGNAKI